MVTCYNSVPSTYYEVPCRFTLVLALLREYIANPYLVERSGNKAKSHIYAASSCIGYAYRLMSGSFAHAPTGLGTTQSSAPLYSTTGAHTGRKTSVMTLTIQPERANPSTSSTGTMSTRISRTDEGTTKNRSMVDKLGTEEHATATTKAAT